MLLKNVIMGSTVAVVQDGSCLRKGARGKVSYIFNDGVIRLTVEDTATAHVHASYLGSRDFDNKNDCEAAGVHNGSVSDVDGSCNHCFCH